MMTPDDRATTPSSGENRAEEPPARRPELPEIPLDRVEGRHLLGRDGLLERWIVDVPADVLGHRSAAGAGPRLATRVAPLGKNRERDRLRRRLRSFAAVDDATLLRPVAVAWGETDLWVIGTHGDVVQLRRLLALATLTPAQAVRVTLGTLRALEAVHRAGLSHGAVDVDSVWITPGGEVLLDTIGGALLSTLSGETGQRLDLAAMERLLLAVLGSRVRQLGGPGGRKPTIASAELVRAAPLMGQAQDVGAAVDALLRAAGDLAGEAAQQTAAVGLAALVDRLRRPPLVALEMAALAGAGAGQDVELSGEPIAPSIPADVREARPAPAAQRHAALQPSQPAPRAAGGLVPSTFGESGPASASDAPSPVWAGRSDRGAGGRPEWLATTPPWWGRRRLRAGALRSLGLLAALAVVAGGAVGVVRLFRHHAGSATSPATTAAPTAPRATPSPSAPPTPTLLPLSAPAPPRAGDVLAVSIATTGAACGPTSPRCTVVVRVDLAPHALETVVWHLVVVDRCTGTTTTEPGSRVTALASYAYVYDDDTLTLPSSHPLAVYAVTDTPAAAASSPLLVGEPSCPPAT